MDGPDAPALAALGILGMVALLVVFLTERVLPRHAACRALHGPVLRVQIALTVLAALAWREVEGPQGRAGEDAMLDAAEALRDALAALLGALSRRRFAPRPAGGRPRFSWPWVAPVRAAPPALRATGLARDGPCPARLIA